MALPVACRFQEAHPPLRTGLRLRRIDSDSPQGLPEPGPTILMLSLMGSRFGALSEQRPSSPVWASPSVISIRLGPNPERP